MPLPLLSSLSRVSLFAAPQARSSGASLSTADGRMLPLVGARLVGEARGGLARLVLEQRYENRYDETLHVTYRMPLPADGAVSAYAFELEGRVIAGRVDRKAAARERFERAIVEGKTAALLEQQRDDIFTQQLGNLPPNQALIARITIDQRLAWLPEGEWELRFPTVIGPRYIGESDGEQDARDTHVAVAPGGVAAGIQIALTIGDSIVAGRGASSPSHTLVHRADGSLELKEAAALDRDLVVRWPVATAACGLSIDATCRPAGDAFGLLTIVPPARDARPEAIARDLIVLLDTSGSMSGGPLDQAKRAVAMLIESLGEQDRLELIEFSNRPRRYQAKPQPATARAKQDAIRWVRSRTADGGTEMGAAVFEALHALRAGAQRQVVVVTDGYVGGEQQIVKLLHERLPKGCRLHVLGVGSAVNRSLATAMARAGRGAEVLVGLDEDVERAMKRMVDRTRVPVLTNVSLLGGALLRHAPEHLPDVYEGAPVVAALALRPEGGELVVRGELAREPWEQRIRVPARAAGEGNQAIAALYAREHVADLETRWTIGDREQLDREIEETGVEFQISTRLTSWVAVDEARRAPGPARHVNVPQALPYGTSAGSFGLRAAADLMLASSRLDLDEGYAELDAPAELLGGALAQSSTLTGGSFEEAEDRAFEREAPTGAPAPGLARPPAPLPVQAPPRPGRPASSPSLESRPVPSSVPSSPGSSSRPSPRPSPAAPLRKPAPQISGRRARAWSPVLALALVLAILAALAWWLVR